MGSRDTYQRRQAATSPHDLILGSFSSSNPSYYQINKNFDFSTQYKCQIFTDHTYKGEIPQKKILTYPGDTLQKGDIIHWKSEDDHWIVWGVDNQYDVNTKGLIRQCSDFMLKWCDKYGTTQSLPCLIIDEFGDGINASKVITTLDGKIRVYTQRHDDLAYGTRLILFGHVFFVSDMVVIGGKDNLSSFYFLDSAEKHPKDDFVNGIAYNDWNNNAWSIEVLNNPVSLTIGGTTTLDVTVKNNWNVVNESVSYLSNNTSIAIVSDDGVITGVADGSTSIKISLSSNPLVFTTVNVEVAAVTSDNFVISLVNPNGPLVDNDALTITVYQDIGQDAYLTIQERNNGELVNTVFTPALTSGSEYISLTITGNNTFTLSPTSTGIAELVIEDFEGHSVTYAISIVTLYG